MGGVPEGRREYVLLHCAEVINEEAFPPPSTYIKYLALSSEFLKCPIRASFYPIYSVVV